MDQEATPWRTVLRSADRLFRKTMHPAAVQLPVEGSLPSLAGATEWLNSEPLTPAGLRGSVVLVDLGPTAPLVKHTYPGEEIICVLEGALEYQVEGQPPTTVKARDVVFVPAGAVHAVRNVGSGNAGRAGHRCRRKGKADPHPGRVSKER